MALSGTTRRIVTLALANVLAGKELCDAIDAASGDLGTPSTPVTPVAVTFTAGGTPSAYTAPTGAVTIANSTSPLVTELLDYCNELRGNIAEIQAVLLAHGLVS